MPGVKFRLNKRSVGLTFGKGPFHYTVNSRGRRTVSAGIPGTGMYYQKAVGGVPYTRRSSTSRTRSVPNSNTFHEPAPPIATGTPAQMLTAAMQMKKPGIFANKVEKRLHRALISSNFAEVEAIASSEPRFALAAHCLALIMVPSSDPNGTQLRETHALAVLSLGSPESDPFITKYVSCIACTIPISPQLSVTLPMCRAFITLMHVENLQEQKRFDEALNFIMTEPISTFTMISSAELFVSMERWDDIITLTTGTENTDDVSALLLTYRGIAFREQGFFDAAREAFADALRSKKRSVEIRHLTLFARAQAAIDQNRHAAARKDLEKILNEDPDYPGLRDEIAKLRGSEPAESSASPEPVEENSGS